MRPTVSAEYTLRSGESWGDPFAMYAALRSEDPVHRVAGGDGTDFWVLTRHRDVMAAARDPETFSSARGLTVTYGELDAIGMADNPPMVMLDPPDHTRFRRLVARGFTPRQVVEIEPTVRRFVTERLDALPDAGPADIVGTLFKPLPSMVVAHYLGVPEEDWARFDLWTQSIVGAVGPTAAEGSDNVGHAAQATMELLGYFTELIAHRRRHPGEDTISALVTAGVADDDRGILSIVAFTFTMVAGGNDTVTGMLGGSAELLAAHPEQRRRLVRAVTSGGGAAGDITLDAAIEELLRLTSPVQGLARTTTRPVTYADTPSGPVTIPAERKVLLGYAAANRDPEVYGDDADTLDITRRPRSILTFSHGNHHCLGASAARMQARVALTELLTRFPEYAIEGETRWAEGNYVRRPVWIDFHAHGDR